MKFQPHVIYHVYNQGNNRQQVFFKEENYEYFLFKVGKFISPLADILSYCLMPNHFHLQIHTRPEACLPCKAIKPRSRFSRSSLDGGNDFQMNLNQAIGTLQSSYTKAINRQENRSGSLFRKEAKAKDGFISEFITVDGKYRDLILPFSHDYNWHCFHYIHLNPMKAGLVKQPEDWPWSSAAAYIDLRKDTLVNKELARKLLVF